MRIAAPMIDAATCPHRPNFQPHMQQSNPKEVDFFFVIFLTFQRKKTQVFVHVG